MSPTNKNKSKLGRGPEEIQGRQLPQYVQRALVQLRRTRQFEDFEEVRRLRRIGKLGEAAYEAAEAEYLAWIERMLDGRDDTRGAVSSAARCLEEGVITDERFFAFVQRDRSGVLERNKSLPQDKVGMYDTKYTDSITLETTEINGCMVVALHFSTESEGVLGHYPHVTMSENLEELSEVAAEVRSPQQGKGVILQQDRLVTDPTSANLIAAFTDSLNEIFKGISLQFLTYPTGAIEVVTLDPVRATWQSRTHGENPF